jgi:hypothetical protein
MILVLYIHTARRCVYIIQVHTAFQQTHYTIMIENVPPSLRSVTALSAFFDKLFPGNQSRAVLFSPFSLFSFFALLRVGIQLYMSLCLFVITLHHSRKARIISFWLITIISHCSSRPKNEITLKT